MDFACRSCYCCVIIVIFYFSYHFYIFNLNYSVRKSRYFSSIYFFSHLYILVWTHRYLLYSLGYNPTLSLLSLLLKLSKFWPLKALSCHILCPFDMALSFVFLSTLLLFLHNKMIQAPCIFPVPALKSDTSPRSPGSFDWRILEMNIWALGVLIADWVSLLLVPLSKQSWEMCSLFVMYSSMRFEKCIVIYSPPQYDIEQS